MGFIGLIAALLFEQWQPLPHGNRAYVAFGRYVATIERKFGSDGRKAWLLAVLPVVICAAAVSALLDWAGTFFVLAWYIGTLYFALGFRLYGNFYSGIMGALQSGDLRRARELLAAWRHQPADELDADEIAREAVDLALLYSHRHVFGVIAWFVVAGPAGALGYRISALLAERRPLPQAAEEITAETLYVFAARAFHYIDYAPVRLTALMFAAVGDFMAAVKRWQPTVYWYQQGTDIVLETGAAALGGMPSGEAESSSGSGEGGQSSGFDYMQAAGGLMWRALVLWLFMIILGTAVVAILF